MFTTKFEIITCTHNGPYVTLDHKTSHKGSRNMSRNIFSNKGLLFSKHFDFILETFRLYSRNISTLFS